MLREKMIRANSRYDALVERLLQRLSALDHETLNRRPADGGWSAIQTLHHLILSEESSMAYVRKKMQFETDFEKAGFVSWRRGVMLWLFLYLPLKFKAPPVVADQGLPDQASLADTAARWRKTRVEWAGFLQNMPDTLVDRAVFKHPRVGRIGWIETLGFFSAHTRRHTGQIERAVRPLN